jgi:hypothetical protein
MPEERAQLELDLDLDSATDQLEIPFHYPEDAPSEPDPATRITADPSDPSEREAGQ